MRHAPHRKMRADSENRKHRVFPETLPWKSPRGPSFLPHGGALFRCLRGRMLSGHRSSSL